MQIKFFRAIWLMLAGAAFALASTSFDAGYSTEFVEQLNQLDAHLGKTKAPAFSLPDLNGKKVDLQEYRGEVVLLNFWATFCKPCKDEMPSMSQLLDNYRTRGLVGLAVSQDPARNQIETFLDKWVPENQSAPFRILWDSDNQIAPRYNTRKIPETYLIDRGGNIAARFVSAYNWTDPKIKKVIGELLSN